MRISKIRLSDFKRHESLEVEPAAGLTIIRGPNEAGKSTIQKGLELVLFRKADSMAKDVLAAHRWGTQDPPVVELDFEVDGAELQLAKRFAGPRGESTLSQGGKAITDPDLIRDRLATLTGVPSEAFFRSTASVGHAELAAVAGDEPLIQDRLQKAISGADRGTAKAKKKLETAIHRYRTEGHKNPGLLKVVREEVAMLERELTTGEAALARLEADRAQWAEAHERRVSLDAQLNLQQADLAEARRAEQLAEARDGAQDRYDRLKRGAELVAQRTELERSMPTEIPLARLRTAVSRASNLGLELAELEAVPSLEALTDATRADAPTPPRPLRWLALAVLLVVAAAAAGFLLDDLLALAALVVLGIGTLLALAQSVRMAFRRRQYALAQGLARGAAQQRMAAEQERQELYRRRRHEFESQLAGLGVEDLAQAEAMLETAEVQTQALARIEGELRGLGVEERNLRRLEAARDEAANECEQARHALSGMGPLADDPATARHAAQRLVEQTLPARDRARSEEDQAQGRVDANQVDAELVASLAERLSAARERAAEMERRVVVYESTLRAIETAERATLKTAARYLEENMGPAISRVTEGRYHEVVVDEKDLAFRVRVPETGELVDVDVLSQGTSDQLFLAARLGLVRLVTMDRRPPLVLDDPFVTFDGPRGERALRLVRDVAAEQGFQVLFLTTSDRFDALADKVVVLEGPTSRPLPRIVAAPAAAAVPAASRTLERAARAATAPEPLLRFEPDPRPGPDTGVPTRTRRTDGGNGHAEGAGRGDGTEPGHDRDESGGGMDIRTGIVDPFRLGKGGGAG